jgi:S-adenosylhomocysteine hydrolase
MLAGKVAVVAGFGDVGKGVRSYNARVTLTDLCSVPSLSALTVPVSS